MTKLPRALAHPPILCSCCAPSLCDPDEPCLILFLLDRTRTPSVTPPSVTPPRARSLLIGFDIGILFPVGSQMGSLLVLRPSSLVAARPPYKPTGSPGLLLISPLLRFRSNLAWSVLFAFCVR